jgi:hypothetical protein
MTDRQTLQRRLLELLSPQEISSAAAAALSDLGPADWDRLLTMARQHRLEPLLHWQLSQRQHALHIPARVGEVLTVSAKRYGLRALVLQRELILIHRLLSAAGIPYQAMKGAFLALHAYPQAGLRPMRDLDILVPRAEALRAYQVLIDGGLMRPARYQGSPEAQILIHKHLPPLMSASGQVMVELHARLQQPPAHCPDLSQSPDPSDDPGYWGRSISRPTAGEALCFPSPTDLLLNLILHAALDHRFNNGPLTLSDIGYLVAAEPIDWSAFWQRAEQGGWTRACWLTLRLVERHWGVDGIVWPAPEHRPESAAAQTALDTAALMLLRDLSATRDVGLTHALQQQASSTDKMHLLLRRLFPTRVWIAGAYPVSATSPRVYLYYLPHLWRLLSQRLPQFLKTRQRAAARDEVTQLAQLERWLAASDTERAT